MSNLAQVNKGHKFHSSILRAYDIRGIVGQTLSPQDAIYIGKTFATSIIRRTGKSNPNIAIAYDGRLSSPELKDALIEGITSTGANAKNFGLGPTPMLYFSVNHHNLDAGVMVTGSHNPPNHNGFKMMIGKKSFFADDILSLGDLAEKNDFEYGNGTVENLSVFDEYVQALVSAMIPDNAKELKVVWDPGNGAAGDAVTALTQQLPGQHIVLNGKIDGNFPAHHPDPTDPKNLVELIAAVKENQCDIGVAFDGDGDRIGAVDSTGRIIWGDQLMVLYSREILKDHPGATIIADVKASEILFKDVADHGGNPIMWKTGHSLIKSKMYEENAKIAGEMSGHIFFADRYFGYDDGIYSAVRLINLVAHSNETLAESMDKFPKIFNTPEIRIETTEERKFVIVDEIKSRLEASGANVNIVDGVRVSNEHGWWLARASNTQSAIIVRCEAQNEASLQALKDQVKEQLKISNVDFTALN